VDWTIMPQLMAPLGLRRGTTGGLTAVMMAPPEDCFAIATPYAGEGHYSLYFSRFGLDFKTGQTARSRTRLIIAPGVSDERAVALYRKYVKELSANSPSGDAPQKMSSCLDPGKSACEKNAPGDNRAIGPGPAPGREQMVTSASP
jgi:hypothetical protein